MSDTFGRWEWAMSLLQPRAFGVSIARTLGTVVVRVTGELDATTAPDLRAALTDLIEGQGNLSVVLDASDLWFVDSAGLGVLIGAARRLHAVGGDFTISAPKPAITKVLEVTGADALFTITRY
jgi:anti-sigma B factor antagonist